MGFALFFVTLLRQMGARFENQNDSLYLLYNTWGHQKERK